MLFQVQYVGEGIEELQNALSYFLNEIKLENHTIFSENLFPETFRTKLYKWGNKTKGFKNYVSEFKAIFDILSNANITTQQRQLFVEAFVASNEIANICNDVDLLPTHFLDIDNSLQEASKHFLTLYTTLYTDFIKEKHPTQFKIKNTRICAICGLDTINPYDHYFPKGTENPIYPFSAVNPKNLIPICSSCNGKKSSKLILFGDNTRTGNRILILFPYADLEGWENLEFSLANLQEPTVADFGSWAITITPKIGLDSITSSKLEKWRDFFEIEQRYAEELKSFIATWTASLTVGNIQLDEIITASIPSRGKVREELGIILKWLFFCLLKQNAVLQQLFFPTLSRSVNPAELLTA